MASSISTPCPGMPNAYCIRQNPYAHTNQQDAKNVTVTHEMIHCPFGHTKDYLENVINGTYNERRNDGNTSSLSQDRAFCEEMKVGDFVIIVFKGIVECILAEVISGPIYDYKTGLFTSMRNNQMRILPEGDTEFNPVIRKIRILKIDVRISDKRRLSQKSLSRLNSNIIHEIIPRDVLNKLTSKQCSKYPIEELENIEIEQDGKDVDLILHENSGDVFEPCNLVEPIGKLEDEEMLFW